MRDLINLVDDLLTEEVEFIFESPADDIIDSLNTTEYKDTIRKSGNTVAVLVPQSKRIAALNDLLAILPDAEYDKNMTGSSFGGIRYAGGKILIKPNFKQGDSSAGVANEMELYNILREMLEEYEFINVTFRDATGGTFVVKKVVDVEHSGKEVVGRLKGDIRLVTKSTKRPISIKKLDAEVWESADTYFGPTAIKILKKLYDKKMIGLQGLGKYNQDGTEYVRISPEVAVEPTEEEIRNVVFGEDIEALKGAVVFQTFLPQHFVRDENELVVECETVIKSLADIPRSHLMVWLIRNDSTRNPRGGIPGLRITAAVQTRAFGKNGTKGNVVYVNRNGKELENPMADVAAQYIASKGKKQAEQLKAMATSKKIKSIASGTSTEPVVKARKERGETGRAKR